MLEAGSVALLPVPFSDQSATKKRPVLLLTDPDSYGDFIAMPITSQTGQPNTLAIQPAAMLTGKLPKPSWVRYDKPLSLHRSLVVKEFGKTAMALRTQAAQALCLLITPPAESEN
jgi:mRNA interferase MazF